MDPEEQDTSGFTTPYEIFTSTSDTTATQTSTSFEIRTGLLATGSLGILIIFANSCVLYTFLTRKTVRKVFVNVYIFYLAIFDWLVGAFLLFATALWGALDFPELSVVACDLWFLTKFYSTLMSAVMIILLSIDRYRLVIDPLGYRSRQTTRRIHRLVQLTSLTFLIYCGMVTAVTHLFTIPEEGGGNWQDCDVDANIEPIYFLINMIVDFLLPWLILVAVNLAFFWKLVVRLRMISRMIDNECPAPSSGYGPPSSGSTHSDLESGGGAPERAASISSRIEQKLEAVPSDIGKKPAGSQIAQERAKLWRIARKLTTYVCVFIFCWTPFLVVSLVPVLGIAVPGWAYNVSVFTLSMNSLINPLLYAVFQSQYRKTCSR